MYAPVPSKLSPPQTRSPLIRKRLIRKLDDVAGRKLTIILGRAAQGKTTLAATYVARSKIPTVWVNLGSEESDPASLYQLLVRALTPFLPEKDLPQLLSYPSLRFGPRQAVPLYKEWATALFDRVTGPIQIICDGADRMIPHAPSWLFFQAMVETLPEDIHLLILSREPPDIDYGQWSQPREVQILTDQDLAFSIRETETFLRIHCGIDLTGEELQKVQHLTGGWIGGLILLSDVLNPNNNRFHRGILEGGPSGGFQTTVNRYFDEAVFNALPPAVQDFLLKTSILDEFDIDQLNHLFPETDNAGIIQSLIDRNLFIETYTQKTSLPIYRFHNLFRDYLSYKRNAAIPDQEVRRLCMEIARYFQMHRRDLTATRFYLKAECFSEAISLIEHFGGVLVRQGRHAILADMLDALPEDMKNDHPWLLFFTSMIARLTEADQNIPRLWKAYEIFSARDQMSGRILCLAFLLEATMMRGRDIIPLQELLQQAENLGNVATPEGLDWEKALLWLNTGLALTIRGGKPRDGFVACQNAWLLAAKAGDPIIQFNALTNACIAATWLGEFHKLPDLLRDIQMLENRVDYPELKILKEKMLSEMHLFRGHLLPAKVCLEKLDRAIAEMGLVYLAPLKLYSDFLLAFFGEAHAEAGKISEQLYQICAAMDHRTGMALSLTFKGANLYWQASFEAASDCFRKSLAIYAEPGCGSGLHENWNQLLLAFTQIHLGQWEDAECRIRKALVYFRQIRSNTFIAEALLALGFLHIRRNRIGEAETCLSQAFELAEDYGIYHFTIPRPAEVIALCIRSLEMRIDERFDYIQKLLIRKFGTRACGPLTELIGTGSRKARRKALEILKAIRTRERPQINIRTLGHFDVCRDQTPIAESEWRGGRSKDFLKVLIARGGRQIPKELVIEDLWPDSSASGEGTFKASLHRLRRVLEPDIDATLGSLYVILNENRISLNPDLFQVDAFRFLTLYEAARDEEQANRPREALERFLEARELYGGDFLPFDPYAQWAQPMRRRLSADYCDLLARIGTLYEQRGALQKACRMYHCLLDAEPLDEAACHRLMTLYARRGLPNKAVRVYEAYRRRLEDELGMTPDPGLEALKRRILSSKRPV